MTIKEYIQMEFSAFGITEAQILDVFASSSIYYEDECSPENLKARQEAMVDILEGIMFRPRVKSISESGISISYDYDGLGKWYLYLCGKIGRTPNKDVVGMLGLSAIIDRTDIW